METLPEEYNILKKLPKSQEAIKFDANARAFYMLLLQGHQPYAVIDEMISHYTKVKNDLYEKLRASGSVAAPTWYTENEMYDWLTRNNYHENIAKELSSKWAADLQGDFNKGFEKGTRELASLRQQLETLRGFVKEVDASLYHGSDLEDKEIMQHYIDVFKIIKEEARKLLSK